MQRTLGLSPLTLIPTALGRRPGTPQVELLSGARDGQSDRRKLLPGRCNTLQRNEEYRPETDPERSEGECPK